MLVLTRKEGERVVIDGDTVVEVLEVRGRKVRLGISAPGGVTIVREEIILADAEFPEISEATPRHLAAIDG